MESFTEAIDLDASYALAFAGRSLAQIDNSAYFVTGAAIPEGFAKAMVDARRAQSLAPDDARILREYGLFSVTMGRADAGLAAARRAVVLDPLGAHSHFTLGQTLFFSHHYLESVTAFNDALALEPGTAETYSYRGLEYYQLGDLDSARSSYESKSDAWEGQWCLALVYDKLGRHADAEVAFAKLTAGFGDAPAYQNAEIYAQWGNRTKSLKWLEKALQVRDPGVAFMRTDPFLDSLRKEPHFQTIERALKFPD